MKKINPSEQSICIGFNDALLLAKTANKIKCGEDFVWFHIPNGQRAGSNKSLRMLAGGIEKRMGTLKGVPDYFLMWTEGNVVKFGYMEAKSKTGALKPEQKKFRDYCKDKNIPWALFRSIKEGVDVLKEWDVVDEGFIVT